MKLKRILILVLAIVLTFTYCSCAKCINTEYKDVEVTIKDEYHRSAYITPMHTGKVMTTIHYPAVYRITVEYEGIEYTIGGSDTYNKYKDKIGETACGQLEIKTYDNGTVKYDIVSLE